MESLTANLAITKMAGALVTKSKKVRLNMVAFLPKMKRRKKKVLQGRSQVAKMIRRVIRKMRMTSSLILRK
jgi:hypothetical protein